MLLASFWTAPRAKSFHDWGPSYGTVIDDRRVGSWPQDISQGYWLWECYLPVWYRVWYLLPIFECRSPVFAVVGR